MIQITDNSDNLQKVVEAYKLQRDSQPADQPDFGPMGKVNEPMLNLIYEAYGEGIKKGLALKTQPELKLNLGMCFLSKTDMQNGPFIQSNYPTRPLTINANLVHVFPDNMSFWSRVKLARVFFKNLNKFYKNDTKLLSK
jgi:hypothetical protein